MAHDTHTPHILPLWLYLRIGIALLVLTIVTVWVAQYHLGPWNLFVAMLIAVTKGTLVAMFFMHLKYASRLYATVFVGALLMLTVFIVFTMFDTMYRDKIYEFEARPISDKAIIYQQNPTSSETPDTASAGAASPASTPVDSGH
ncbi:MAG: cytochrome C oxidase subunit IV family protein [Candidatus Zixiibacteriota bacterium]